MRKLSLLMVCVMVLGLFACSTEADNIINDNEIDEGTGLPLWAIKGSGLYEGENGHVILSVGIASYDPNPQLMTDQAKAYARNEISKILGLQVKTLTETFMESAKDYMLEDDLSSSTEYFMDAAQQLSNNYLVGSEMVNSFQHKEVYGGAKDGRGRVKYDLYVLMEMDLSAEKFLEDFKEEASRIMEQRREEIRDRIANDKDEALERMNSALNGLTPDNVQFPSEAAPADYKQD